MTITARVRRSAGASSAKLRKQDLLRGSNAGRQPRQAHEVASEGDSPVGFADTKSSADRYSRYTKHDPSLASTPLASGVEHGRPDGHPYHFEGHRRPLREARANIATTPRAGARTGAPNFKRMRIARRSAAESPGAQDRG